MSHSLVGEVRTYTSVSYTHLDVYKRQILSGFDPVRREIARLALHQLVTDGRIHPARIEEVVAKVEKQIEEEIIEVGKRTAIDLGIHGLHPDMIRLIGKMKYRSSYGPVSYTHLQTLCVHIIGGILDCPNKEITGIVIIFQLIIITASQPIQFGRFGIKVQTFT